MRVALNLAEIIFAILLIVLILLQGKGNSASAFFNREATTTYRTRRGIEKTLLQATVLVAILLCVTALANVLLHRYGAI
ncbi:MAG: hypothetical protein NVS4B8_02440 [Herpetosiphon sp.]